MQSPSIRRIDAATGEVNDLTPGLDWNAVGAGSAWFYGNGNLGLFDNTNRTFYQIKINNPTSAAPTFTLVSVFQSTVADDEAGANDGASNPIITPVDLSIVKTGPLNYIAGESVTYTLTVKNEDPTLTSSGSAVTDTLPSALINISAPNCTVHGQNLSCPVGALASGQSATIFVSATVADTFSGQLTNTAKVIGNEPDNNPANSSSTATTDQQVRVSFDNQCGNDPCSDTPDDQVVDAGDTVTKPEDPTRDGHTFQYWYPCADANEAKFNFSSPVDANKQLCAKWEAIPPVTPEPEVPGVPDTGTFGVILRNPWFILIAGIVAAEAAVVVLRKVSARK